MTLCIIGFSLVGKDACIDVAFNSRLELLFTREVEVVDSVGLRMEIPLEIRLQRCRGRHSKVIAVEMIKLKEH